MVNPKKTAGCHLEVTNCDFKMVFDAIRQLMTPPPGGKRKIGFGDRE